MALSIILKNALQNSLLEMSWNGERCYASPQLLHLLRIVCIRRMLQSIGIPKRLQILAKRAASTKDEVVSCAFSSSTWRESIPGDFQFFIALIAVSTSAWEGGLHVVNVQIIRRVRVRRLIKLWQVKHFFEMLDPSCIHFLFSCSITFPSFSLSCLTA